MQLATGLDVKPEGALCERCSLNKNVYVDSYGDESAEIVIVGEAPGFEEMKKGQPFVGRSGKLLMRVLNEFGIKREQLYITNAVACHPDDNKTPSRQEILACSGRLMNELKKHPHKAIILLGNIALKAVLGGNVLKKYIGSATWDDRFNCYVFVTYHPAAVLRNPALYNDFYKHLYDAVHLNVKETPTIKEVKIITPDNYEELIKEIEELSSGILTIDIETASNGEILVIGMCPKTGYIYQVTKEGLKNEKIFKALQDLYSNQKLNAHNAKFDYEILRQAGLVFKEIGFDTMLAMYVLDERAGKHGLEVLAKNEFNAPIYYEEAEKFYDHMEDMPVEKMLEYNALDVNYCHAGMEVLKSRLDENDRRVLYNILIPATYPLARMETTGILVDTERLEQLDKEFSDKIEQLKLKMFEMVGKQFNPNSPKQLIDIMHNVLEIPVIDKISTDKDTLTILSQFHDFPKILLEYRQYVKLKSTYIDGIKEHLDKNNRLHGRFNLHVTATGRLSSSNPNLQNIPKHQGPVIRDLFISPPGYKFLEFDLQQAELRVVAWLAQDKKFIELIDSGVDVHTATTMLITGLPADKIDKEMRQIGKKMNFAIVYQQTAQGTADELGISIEEAEELHRKLAENMPGVVEWIEKTKQQIIKTGMVITPLGRKRRFGIINDDALREGVNMPVQSVASDIMLLSIANLHKYVDWENIRLLITVHDSLLVEVKEELVDYWAKKIVEVIKQTAKEIGITVNIGVDVSIGDRWGSMEEYKI